MAHKDSNFISCRDMILLALRKLGIIRQGGSLLSEQFTEGLQALNIILSELNGLFNHQWLIHTYD